ncbi:hypothetical protein IMCC12053_2859 [Celeribacter marinus]|uniref:Uncharacterized protein n=1 Tax=Celeribacter marinus TaxID=1397108 RepID=A0A0N9ZJC6_9RHOB|nr:hypothetical protein IMCC12053_2859 [Celeribacter marinus]
MRSIERFTCLTSYLGLARIALRAVLAVGSFRWRKPKGVLRHEQMFLP